MTASSRDELAFPDDLVARVAGPSRSRRLTERQRRVAGLVADGLADRAIAAELGVSPAQVARHVAAIRRALGAADDRELAARVWRERLVALEMDLRAGTAALSGALRSTPGQLAMVLSAIEANDAKYAPRHGLVLKALTLAHHLGYPAGVRIDPAEPDWPVVLIELPRVGQVSWHLPAHVRAWDGHGTREKYARCRAYVAQAS